MPARDFLLLSLVCVVWGLNFVVTKWIVSGFPGTEFDGAPPIFAAFMRFALLAIILAPLLRRPPAHVWQVAGVGLMMGGLHFTFLFIGLRFATPSTAAVAIQLFVPFTTMLSILFLGERIGFRRGAGIALAIVGVALIAYDPANFDLTVGVLFIACAALAGAAGTVLIKMIDPVGPFEMQAWTGAVSFIPLLALSLTFETGQLEAVSAGGWRLALALAYVVVVIAVFSHAAYYWIVRRHDASLVTPLALMAPIWGMVFGVLIAGDPFTIKLAFGAAIALSGVGLIAGRSGPSAIAPGAKEAAE